MTFISESPQETKDFARDLAINARSGQVYELTGDLGAGKTAFSQGFAEGLGIKERVTSPTFTILNVYESGRMPLYHFDCYRLGDPEEIIYTGIEDFLGKEGICLIEWAEIIKDFLPRDTILVKIEMLGNYRRKITIQREDLL